MNHIDNSKNEGLSKKRILLNLLLTFIKIGLFTFGGGYAMISVFENICVEKKKWITHDDMMDVTVIAESTPGPISINCATFIGYKSAGIIGSIVATIGIVLPSFVIILIISKFLDNFLEYKIIANAFKGIKVGVGILIVNAAVTMLEKMEKSAFPLFITICSFAVMMLVDIFSWNFSSILLMLIVAILGLFIFWIKRIHAGKGGAE